MARTVPKTPNVAVIDIVAMVDGSLRTMIGMLVGIGDAGGIECGWRDGEIRRCPGVCMQILTTVSNGPLRLRRGIKNGGSGRGALEFRKKMLFKLENIGEMLQTNSRMRAT
jgi:hypothetical protein